MFNRFKGMIITQTGWLLILIVLLLGLQGYSSVIDNIQSRDTQQIISQLNQTAARNQQALEVSEEVRDRQIRDIEESQNRTAELLPVFFRQFNQTDVILEAVQNLSMLDAAAEKRTQRLLPPFEQFLTEALPLQQSADEDRDIIIRQLQNHSDLLAELVQSFNNSSTNQ